MRRWLFITIITVLPLVGVVNAGQKPHRGPAQICTQKAQTVEGVKALIKCFAPKIGVSTSEALYIAYRESRFNPNVCNASDHCGVYQDARAIWNFEASHYIYGKTLGVITRTNGRANVILNLRYVRHNNWGPWSR